jgi:hypothetical protein
VNAPFSLRGGYGECAARSAGRECQETTLPEHALRRGSHTSTVQLRAAITEYLDAHNEAPKPFRWTRAADEILESIARFATRTLAAHSEA